MWFIDLVNDAVLILLRRLEKGFASEIRLWSSIEGWIARKGLDKDVAIKFIATCWILQILPLIQPANYNFSAQSPIS